MPIENNCAVSQSCRLGNGVPHQGGTHSQPFIVRMDTDRAKIQNFYFPIIRHHYFRQTVDDVTCNPAFHFRNKIKIFHKRREIP